MILEKGITGFFDVGVCPLVENDYTAFKQVCYSIQTKTTNLLNIYKPDNANYENNNVPVAQSLLAHSKFVPHKFKSALWRTPQLAHTLTAHTNRITLSQSVSEGLFFIG